MAIVALGNNGPAHFNAMAGHNMIQNLGLATVTAMFLHSISQMPMAAAEQNPQNNGLVCEPTCEAVKQSVGLGEWTKTVCLPVCKKTVIVVAKYVGSTMLCTAICTPCKAIPHAGEIAYSACYDACIKALTSNSAPEQNKPGEIEYDSN